MVLTIAWKSICAKTLPFVRLNSHVWISVPPRSEMKNAGMIAGANSFPNSGKCQSAQIGARIRLATNGVCRACKRGSANPR